MNFLIILSKLFLYSEKSAMGDCLGFRAGGQEGPSSHSTDWLCFHWDGWGTMTSPRAAAKVSRTPKLSYEKNTWSCWEPIHPFLRNITIDTWLICIYFKFLIKSVSSSPGHIHWLVHWSTSLVSFVLTASVCPSHPPASIQNNRLLIRVSPPGQLCLRTQTTTSGP